MRLFLAINLPLAVKTAIAKELPRFKYLKFRQIPEEDWHITFKFIGEVKSDVLDIIQQCVKPITERSNPFELKIKDVGFLNRHIFSFNINRSAKLYGLFRIIDERLASDYITHKEDHPFSPHITVGRRDKPISYEIHPVRHFDLINKEPILFTVDSIDLMKSTLTPQGPIYNIVEKYTISHKP